MDPYGIVVVFDPHSEGLLYLPHPIQKDDFSVSYMEQDVPEIYTTTTQDIPEYKAILCGRKDDISTLINYIVRGDSVAMFGERKIGKTSVLYLIRDIINGSINDNSSKAYHTQLIDSDLKNAIANLQARIPHYKSCYISFQIFQQYSFEAFVRKMHKRGQEIGLIPSVNSGTPSLNYRDMEIFDMLNTACSQSRLVVLIDEIEVIKNFPFQERMKVVRNLRSATAYANLCFIIAGAENWYEDLKDGSIPLSGVLKIHTLSAPNQSSTVLHLIRQPLENYLLPYSYVNTVVTTVQDWTGCKPFYVQAVCSSVVKIYHIQNRLPQDWRTRVQKDVYNDTAREVLKQFYGNDNTDVLAQNILALLANIPHLTTQQITRLLGDDKEEKVVQERLDDLMVFNKISQQDEKYHIVGTLIEQWGREHKPIRPIKSPWPQRRSIALKLTVIIVALGLGILAFIYANPPKKIIPLKFADGTVVLEVPSSLEEDQTGTIVVSVENDSHKPITSIDVSLTSEDVNYQLSNSSRLTFTSIEPGEKKFLSPTATVHSSPSTSILTQVIVTEDTKQFRSVQFGITQRYPIRKYGALVGLLLTALAGLAVGKDIWNFIISRGSTLSSGKSDNTQSDG